MKASKHTNTRMGDLHLDLENLMDHFFGNSTVVRKTDWVPRTDITESELGYSLIMELPGVAAADVNVETQDGRLEISGERRIDELPEGTQRLKSERRAGAFRRVFEFSTQVDPSRIEAEFKNGLLIIDLPKSEKVLPKKIQIKVAE